MATYFPQVPLINKASPLPTKFDCCDCGVSRTQDLKKGFTNLGVDLDKFVEW